MNPGSNAPKVFISYSHDSQEHKDRVLELVNRLRTEGIDCNIDQYEESPVDGWPRWMMNQLDWADFVIVVCTEQYNCRFRGKEEPGKGRGVTWEGAIINQELYDAHVKSNKFIPVLFSTVDENYIPITIRGFSRYILDTEEGYVALYRRLTNQPLSPKPPLGQKVELSPRVLPPLPARERKQTFPRNPSFFAYDNAWVGREDLIKDLSSRVRASSRLFITEIHIESLTYIGIRQVNSGSYKEGVKILNEALVKIDSIQEFSSNYKIQRLKSDILENFALYQMNSSNFQEAIQLYNKVINIRKKLGLFHRLISPYAHVGILMRKLAKYEEALFYLNEARVNAEKLNDESQVYWIDHHLAFIYLNQGRPDLAEKLCNACLKNSKKFQDRWGESDCYEQLGLIDLSMKRYNNAEMNFNKALSVRQYLGNLHGTASSVLDIALASWYKRNIIKSIYYLLKGFYLYYKLGVLNFTRFHRLLKLAFIWTLGNQKWIM